MSRDSKYDILFEPVQIGPHTLRNRLVQPPQCSSAGTDNPGFQAEHRAMKAEGGYAAVFTELVGIAPGADGDPFILPELWDDNDVANLRLMAESVREHGALAGVELGYQKYSAVPKSRQSAYGPTQIATEMSPAPHGASHIVMAKDDVHHLRQLFVDAVKRAIDASFDLISIHMSHGTGIMQQFLNPYYNRRTDEYGGSFENRARLSREIMEDVAVAIGAAKVAVGLRFAVDTLPEPFGVGDAGVRKEEGFRFIEHMDDLVDFWDLNVGGSDYSSDIASSRSHPENGQAPYTTGAKDHTEKPVVNVGRFTNPDTMVEVIRSGQADIIGTVRPSIADPFLPRKIEEGRLEDIRECIGCNMCVSRFEQSARLVCTQNATSGEEFRRGWHPERFTPATNRDNDVLVVGAGPAGMECAMVLGRRGMRRVHLVDAEPQLGGSLRWISQLPGRGEWARVINYRQIQLDKLKNVTFVPQTRLDVEGVLEYGAEIVIFATGSRWDPSGANYSTQAPLQVTDAGRARILTPEQIMVEGCEPGKRVIVYDADNYYMGVGLAERLAAAGHRVTLLTPDHQVASYTEVTFEQPEILADLRRLGVRMLVDATIEDIGDGQLNATVGPNEDEYDFEFDSMVVVGQRLSNDMLYQQLRGRSEALQEAEVTGLYRVGDCVSPTFIADAIFDGHRLAREIDSPDPSRPLPFIRERRVVHGDDSSYSLSSLKV